METKPEPEVSPEVPYRRTASREQDLEDIANQPPPQPVVNAPHVPWNERTDRLTHVSNYPHNG